MESYSPDCHHVIPRHPKPRADEDPPDPDPDDPAAADHDDHNDPDDLPNISTFIFTEPRTGAQSLTKEASILNQAAIQVVPDFPGRHQPIQNEDERTEENAIGKSNIELKKTFPYNYKI